MSPGRSPRGHPGHLTDTETGVTELNLVDTDPADLRADAVVIAKQPGKLRSRSSGGCQR